MNACTVNSAVHTRRTGDALASRVGYASRECRLTGVTRSQCEASCQHGAIKLKVASQGLILLQVSGLVDRGENWSEVVRKVAAVHVALTMARARKQVQHPVSELWNLRSARECWITFVK